MRLLPLLITLYLLLYANTGRSESLTLAECQHQVDAFVIEDAEIIGDPESRLETLRVIANRCPDFPQLLHNLGVLSARLQQWDKAVAFLQQSLSLDSRAAHTAAMLQKIHRFQAVKAYREALQSNNPSPKPPMLELQNSEFKNFSPLDTPTISAADSEFQIQTLLENWWQFAIARSDECTNCFESNHSTDQFRLKTDQPIEDLPLPNATYLEVNSSYLVVLLKDVQNQMISLGLKSKPSGWQIDQLQVIP